MKEILLDLVECTRSEIPDIDDDLVDFGVVGPGPRRILNWINGRHWFDNDQDRSPAAERMYIDELRHFRGWLRERTIVDELRELNLLAFSLSFVVCPSLLICGAAVWKRQKSTPLSFRRAVRALRGEQVRVLRAV